MIEMGFPQGFEPLDLRVPEVMNAVVHHVIGEVPGCKAGGIGPYQITIDQAGQSEQ